MRGNSQLGPGLSAIAGCKEPPRGGAPGGPTALQVARKQLRVAGQECALPPPANFRPQQRKQELAKHISRGRAGAAEHPCGPGQDARADLPLLARERPGAGLARVGHRGPRGLSLPGKGVAALLSRRTAGCAATAESEPPSFPGAPLYLSGSAKTRAGARKGWLGVLMGLRPPRGDLQSPTATPVINSTGSASSSGGAEECSVSGLHFLKGRERK